MKNHKIENNWSKSEPNDGHTKSSTGEREYCVCVYASVRCVLYK